MAFTSPFLIKYFQVRKIRHGRDVFVIMKGLEALLDASIEKFRLIIEI
jgi:hypothetical protein